MKSAWSIRIKTRSTAFRAQLMSNERSPSLTVTTHIDNLLQPPGPGRPGPTCYDALLVGSHRHVTVNHYVRPLRQGPVHSLPVPGRRSFWKTFSHVLQGAPVPGQREIDDINVFSKCYFRDLTPCHVKYLNRVIGRSQSTRRAALTLSPTHGSVYHLPLRTGQEMAIQTAPALRIFVGWCWQLRSITSLQSGRFEPRHLERQSSKRLFPNARLRCNAAPLAKDWKGPRNGLTLTCLHKPPLAVQTLHSVVEQKKKGASGPANRKADASAVED